MTKHLRPCGPLTFRAGPAAYREIQQYGFRPERIGTLLGASGGAKWLVLSQLDRVIVRRLLPQLEGPVHTLGTSIGAWRLACYAQADPVAAIERFEDAYLGQSYSENPDRAEISERTSQILDTVLGDTGVEEILAHPNLRSCIMAVRSRHWVSSERAAVLGSGLITAAGLNAVSRRLLGLFFDRVLFHDSRTDASSAPAFFSARGFPMYRVPLAADNLREAVTATGSIPLVLNGVRNISGAPRGMYRDGGVIDYHMDLPHSDNGRLALFPHFYDFIKPGWFDKGLPWRRPLKTHIDNTILISPSAEFVERLPNCKIPDRTDFKTFSPEERERAWRGAVKACVELGDDLEDVLENNRLAERMELFVP